MPEWKKAGGILVSEPEFIKRMMKNDASFVLVDIRAPAVALQGHIPDAVSIPAGELATAKDKFPSDKTAPIILYSAEANDLEAFNLVRGWGYKNTSTLNNGVAGWAASQGKIIPGNMPTAITYIKKTPKGEISIWDFKAIAKSMPADKFILDVRDRATAKQGKLAGATNIPLAELESRLGEIPKDEEIIIHCNTGIMAGMAAEALRKNGYENKVLNAVVQIDAQGNYEITEK